MTLRTRRKLFVFFIFLFILASVGTVYYTQGYRFDFQEWKPTRTGSLYVESYIRPVSIFLNDKQHDDRSGLLKRGTLISSVIPKKYTVRIEKEGFIPYEKNIDIRESRVVRLYYVLPVPENLRPSATFPVADALRLVDSNESGKVLVEGTGSYTVLDMLSPGAPLALDPYLASLTRNAYSGFRFQRGTSDGLIGLREESVDVIRIGADAISVLLRNTFDGFFVGGRNLFGFVASSPGAGQASSTVFVHDLRTGSRLDTFDVPFEASDVVRAEGFDLRYLFLLSNGDVWVREDGEFQKIAHDAVFGALSPDGYKVLYQDSGGSVFVYMLRDEFEALDLPARSTTRVQLADAAEARDLQWHADSYHIFAGFRDKIVLSEIIRGEPTNQPAVWQGPYDSFLHDAQSGGLFVLRDGVISRFDAWYNK